MEGLVTTLFLFCIVSSSSCSTFEDAATTSIFNVLNYGAVGDGRHDASQAFLRAWRDVCGATGPMPTLLVPAGNTFLLKPLTFQGPCSSNRIHVQISGTIVAPNGMYACDKKKWMQFSDVNGLIVDGGGEIDGKGYIWWKHSHGHAGSSRPTALSFHNCNGMQLKGLKHVNSQRNHISISSCHGVDISHLQILAPEDSPNTDGIDISASSYVHIHNSMIGTGDDCIAINGFSSYINISDILCGPGHGISIGSLGKNEAYETVEEVHVRSCTFKGTQNGARIKTWQGGSGFVRKISFGDIVLIDTENPIIINQRYVDNVLSGYKSDIKISDITYRNFRGSSADQTAIKLDCSSREGCTNIEMDNVQITCSKSGEQTYAFCNNAHGRYASSFPVVSCLEKISSWW